MSSSPSTDRDARVGAVLQRARLVVNRTPHFTTETRREANRGLDLLERQLGLNQVNTAEAGEGFELIIHAHSSIAFGLLRDPDVAERFSPALRQLGLRGIIQRLDEVTHSVMAEPIPGPTGGRLHRDELPPEERRDASGAPLPPPPGHY
jgi:hypothetical protein